MTRPLLGNELKVINLGIEDFAADLEASGVLVVQVDWRPPAGGDERLLGLLARLDRPSSQTPPDGGEPPSGKGA